MSIILYGLFGCFLGLLLGCMLIMNRVTLFLHTDALTALIILIGSIIGTSGFMMWRNNQIFSTVHTIPAADIPHSRASLILCFTLMIIGVITTLIGMTCNIYIQFNS